MDKASLYWYHPHLHGKTMEQVLMGAAGLIIVRDSEEAAITLPRQYGIDDVPLVFQFKTMDIDNQWVMNDDTDNVVLVNSVIDGFVNSPAQVVRYRILNASTHRVFRFGFSNNLSFFQITSDAGLLNAPVALTRLDLSPGERAEILVDLSGLQGDTLYFQTFGNELPQGVPGGPAGMGMTEGPLDNITFTVLQINVIATTINPVTTIPVSLTTNNVWSQMGAVTRTFSLSGTPMMNPTDWFINGVQFDMNTINFYTQQNNVEIWNITNNSMMAHPFHIHGNYFYILSKDGVTPPVNEQGRKDVVLVSPMGSASIITKYEDFSDDSIPYMYHCHILHHEENGMMGQFIVSLPTSINQIPGSNGFIIYPNPANSVTFIRPQMIVGEKCTVKISDVSGKLIYEENFLYDGSSICIPVLEYANGIYLAEVSNQEMIYRKNMILRH